MPKNLYIQLFNVNEDPVYLELRSGDAMWSFPDESFLQYVRYVSHLNDKGVPYYESIVTGDVSWNLPTEKMTTISIEKAQQIQAMDRSDCELEIGLDFNENESSNQILSLDEYLEEIDQLKQTGVYVPPNDDDFLASLRQISFDSSPAPPPPPPQPPTASPAAKQIKTPSISSNIPFFGGNKALEQSDDETEENNYPEPDDDDIEDLPTAGIRGSLSTLTKKSADLKSLSSLKATVVKSGYLFKLATISGRNWKKRFFILNPYSISYYENEKVNQKPKGEILITSEMTVTEEAVDKKYGFGFRLTGANDHIVTAASTEIDRAHWIQVLRGVIKFSSSYLMENLQILSESTAIPKAKGTFGFSSNSPQSKFCILSEDVISIHPDKDTVTTIEGMINITHSTKIEKLDDKSKSIYLIDADIKKTKLAIQFSNDKSYQLWKKTIENLIASDRIEALTDDFDSKSVSQSKQASNDSSAKNSSNNSTNIFKSEQPKTTIPINVPKDIGVFGLGFDEDDEDDDGASFNSDAYPGTNTTTLPQTYVQTPELTSSNTNQQPSPAGYSSARGIFPTIDEASRQSLLQQSQPQEDPDDFDYDQIYGGNSLKNENFSTSSASAVKSTSSPTPSSPATTTSKPRLGKSFLKFAARNSLSNKSATNSNASTTSIPQTSNQPSFSQEPLPKQVQAQPVLQQAPLPKQTLPEPNSFLSNYDSDSEDDLQFNKPIAQQVQNTGSISVVPPPPLPSKLPSPPHPSGQIPALTQSVPENIARSAPAGGQTMNPLSSNNSQKSNDPQISQANQNNNNRERRPVIRKSFKEQTPQPTNTQLIQPSYTANMYPQEIPEVKQHPTQQYTNPQQIPSQSPQQIPQYLSGPQTFTSASVPVSSVPTPTIQTAKNYLNEPILSYTIDPREALMSSGSEQLLQQNKELVQRSTFKLEQLQQQLANKYPFTSSFNGVPPPPLDNLILEKQQILNELQGYIQQAYPSSTSQFMLNLSTTTTLSNSTNLILDKLYQEKQSLLKLYYLIQLQDQITINQIQQFEQDSINKIKKETQDQRENLQTFQEDWLTKQKQIEDSIQSKIQRSEQLQKHLMIQQDKIQQMYGKKMKELVVLAKELSHQYMIVQTDRKKILKQRFALDLQLQELQNTLTAINSSEESPNSLQPPLPFSPPHQSNFNGYTSNNLYQPQPIYPGSNNSYHVRNIPPPQKYEDSYFAPPLPNSPPPAFPNSPAPPSGYRRPMNSEYNIPRSTSPTTLTNMRNYSIPPPPPSEYEPYANYPYSSNVFPQQYPAQASNYANFPPQNQGTRGKDFPDTSKRSQSPALTRVTTQITGVTNAALAFKKRAASPSAVSTGSSSRPSSTNGARRPFK